MKIITAQDFNQIPYNVPNALAQAPNGGTEENAQFAAYIDTEVKDILINLLGGSLYYSFIAGLEALPSDWTGELPTSYMVDDEVLYNNFVWKSLVDLNQNIIPIEGVNWTKVDNKWLMLRDGIDYFISSNTRRWVGMKRMLVPYIYSIWLRDTYDDHTKVGVVTRKAENADVISSAKRISRAYNKFAGLAGGLYNQHNTLFGYIMYAQTELQHFTNLYDNVTYQTFGDYMRRSFRCPGSMNFMNI